MSSDVKDWPFPERRNPRLDNPDYLGSRGSVRLFATRGTISGIFFLLAHYSYGWASEKRWCMRIRKPLVTLLNRTGRYLDRKTPSLKDINRHVTAIPEFFVVARR